MRRWSPVLWILGGCLLSGIAAAEGTGLAAISENITKSFEAMGKLIIAVSYVSGLAMVVVGIFKFKQHKDNPQQVPMGTPITILGVGILLIFFPSIIQPAGETIFGNSKTAGGFTGEGVSGLK